MTTCRATRVNLTLAFALAGVFALRSTLALSAEDDMLREADVASSAAHGHKYSAELKPLPTLATLLPGSAGIGAEFEAKLAPHFAVYADVHHLRLRLSDEIVDDMQKDQDSPDSIPRDSVTTMVGAGGRYYGSPTGDSWYLGAKVGGGTSHVRWAYADEDVADTSLAYKVGGEAGYRWVWDSRLLVRLGVGLEASSVSKREIRADTGAGQVTDDAKADIRAQNPSDRPRLATTVDLGIGLVF